ncbi:MAG: hypothetical protein EPN23_11425 [Verrucomicrobia bacterium]|nr:MAG: hypothetical protein EPN23_11425 [Verrucomicrobiota bacterium]
MSNGSPSKSLDVKALLQELKTNRRTQGMLVLFVIVLVWLWPSAPKKKAGPGRVGSMQAAGLDDRQIAALQKLPDLAKLDMAGELPNETKMHRDLFLFEGLPPKFEPLPKPKEPDPPTPAELEALAKKAAWESMFATRPQALRYIGFLESKSAGIIGAFFKGEEPFTFQIGHMENTNWKLVKLGEAQAEFQNTKYPDMKMVLQVRDYAGSSSAGSQVTNEF